MHLPSSVHVPILFIDIIISYVLSLITQKKEHLIIIITWFYAAPFTEPKVTSQIITTNNTDDGKNTHRIYLSGKSLLEQVPVQHRLNL